MPDVVSLSPAPPSVPAFRRPMAMAGRCLRLSRRNVEATVTSVVLPVVLLLLFVYLFGGAIQVGTRYLTYVVPGVILLCAGFGSASTAVAVAHDLGGGLLDRLRAMDVGGGTVLAGHVAASVVRNAVATTLVLAVALAIGFRPTAGVLDWLGAAAVLLAFVIALSSLAAVAGLVASSPEGANGFTFLLVFLPYASSAFVPVRTMPSWLRGFAENQPITPIVETLRGLLLGAPLHGEPWKAAAWCAALLVVSVALAGTLFGHRTR